MSEKQDPLAVIEDDGNIEMPIDVVGDHVKSGRKILADIDPGTGAVTVRDRYLHLSDVILEKVQEQQAWEKSQGMRPEGPMSEEDVAAAKAQAEALDHEAGTLEPEEQPQIAGVDTAGLHPAVLALLQQQAQLIEKLADRANTDAAHQELSRKAGVVAEGQRLARAHMKSLEDDINFAKENGVPMPPKKNPRFGEKTPAYVDWLREHRRDKYTEVFGVIAFDKSVSIRGKDGQIVNVITDVARRKTHRSIKPDADPSLSPDMDWNA